MKHIIRNINYFKYVALKIYGVFSKGDHGPEGEAWDGASLAGLTTWEGRWEPLIATRPEPFVMELCMGCFMNLTTEKNTER